MHNKCNVLQSSQNHPALSSPWKNCLPRNRSLVPKRLGTADFEHFLASPHPWESAAGGKGKKQATKALLSGCSHVPAKRFLSVPYPSHSSCPPPSSCRVILTGPVCLPLLTLIGKCHKQTSENIRQDLDFLFVFYVFFLHW